MKVLNLRCANGHGFEGWFGSDDEFLEQNGGGRIDREYALGKGALDLLVTWKTQRIAIELKQRHDTRTLAKGVTQVAAYAASLGLTEAWLVLFDKRKTVPWGKRLFRKALRRAPVKVNVVGC